MIGSDPMDHELVVERDDVGSPDPRDGWHDADAMQPPTEWDQATVRGAATGSEPCEKRGLTTEVATQPLLALGQERYGVSLAIVPAGSSGDGHDDASIGVQYDPESPRSRRMTERERDRAAGEVGDGARLERATHVSPGHRVTRIIRRSATAGPHARLSRRRPERHGGRSR